MPDKPEKSIVLVEKLRKKFPNVVVIIFTAKNDIRYLQLAKKVGGFDYFVKEFGVEDRNPLSYYNRLKWLIGRAKELADEKKTEKLSSINPNDTYIYTCKVPHYIKLSSDDESMVVNEEWNSYFAFIVDAVAKNTGKTDIEDKRNRLLEWLLREPADGRGLCLRYISDPERETISIAIIGKGKASTRQKSIAIAQAMQRNISYLFQDFRTYHFVSAQEEKDLFAVLEPFRPSEIKTIYREPLPLNIKDRNLQAVFPFSFNEKTYLDNLIGTFMRHDAPLMINISLWPLDMKSQIGWYAREIQKARETFELMNPKGEASVTVDSGHSRVRKYMPIMRDDEILAHEQEVALKLLEEQIQSLKYGALYSRFDVVSGSDIPSMVLETLRYDFFGGRGKMRTETYAGEEMLDAWHRIKFLDYKKPQKTPDMLMSLADISQAKSIFQLAIPDEGGVKGVQSYTIDMLTVPPEIKKKLGDDKGFLIAQGFAKNATFPVFVHEIDLMKHMYICGRSGSGKSTLIKKMALSFSERNKGFCILDPHGDVALSLIDLLPEHRRSDLIIFDPTDPECKERLNLIENDGSELQMSDVFEEIMGFIKRTNPSDHLGSILERCLKYSLYLVMLANKTLPDVQKLWHDKEFRKLCVEKIDRAHPVGQQTYDFWQVEMERSDGGDWVKGLDTYVISKLEPLYTSEILRRYLNSPKSTIDFEKIMNQNKILIVRLPGNVIGDETSYIMRKVIAMKLRQAIFKRATIAENKRSPFYIIIDEFQKFLSTEGLSYKNDDTIFSSLLSEARKFRVSLILANQFISQLGKEMTSAIFGNVQSRIIFPIGAEDAAFIKAQIPSGPPMESYVMGANYYAYTQLLIKGEQFGPFTIKTIPVD